MFVEVINSNRFQIMCLIFNSWDQWLGFCFYMLLFELKTR